jgi:hypothetical protein
VWDLGCNLKSVAWLYGEIGLSLDRESAATFQNVRRFNAWVRVARDERASLNFRHYLNAGELAAWQIGGAQNFSGKSWRRLLSRRRLRTRNQTDSGTNSADSAVGEQSASKHVLPSLTGITRTHRRSRVRIALDLIVLRCESQASFLQPAN